MLQCPVSEVKSMNQITVATTAERLKYLMNLYHLKQSDILRRAEPYAGECGVKMNRSDLSQYVSGKVVPGQDKLMLLGKALHVDPVWLMGVDVPMQPLPEPAALPDHPDILPVTTQRIPLMGEIACGEPIYASEDLSASVLVNAPIACDFALRCKGDSMVDARILDGDTVFIRRQDYVDDGAIAAVLIDDEATLKRVYHLADGRVELRAANVRYAPIIVGGENDTRTVRVLGKAVGFQSAFV